ncbi:P-loop containing nucleoside triphosphate hydrolase protein [Ephemerocybe angulata]|uniref:P-loop containing nucleoside triphosphate hydrolase protein n=1 Tax=Ephemerocybe angulata TaxID=980116 RepID=A0A8H6LWE2_9AGAR|nr:P-loop containing nucleoside triphosphate hydrolase protein [Tulosesus angulatus]
MGESRRFIIPVMGMTKAGKSSFINTVASLPKDGQPKLEVGTAMVSCTKKLQIAEAEGLFSKYPSLEKHRLQFVDTPGFDDTDLPDYEILQLIADHLKASCRKGDILGGVLYLHDLSRDGFTGTAKKNLKLFDNLCGENSMFKVIFVTTKWERRSVKENYEAREKELKDVHWESMINLGAATMRLEKEDHASAIEIVDEVLRRYVNPKNREKKLLDQVLQIQRELVAEKKYLPQTEAAKSLLGELEAHAKILKAGSQGGTFEDMKEHDEKLGKLERQIAEVKLNISQRAGSFLKRWFRSL